MNIITGGKLSHNRNVVIRNSVRFCKVVFIVIWEYSTITHVPGTQGMLPAWTQVSPIIHAHCALHKHIEICSPKFGLCCARNLVLAFVAQLHRSFRLGAFFVFGTSFDDSAFRIAFYQNGTTTWTKHDHRLLSLRTYVRKRRDERDNDMDQSWSQVFVL